MTTLGKVTTDWHCCWFYRFAGGCF